MKRLFTFTLSLLLSLPAISMSPIIGGEVDVLKIDNGIFQLAIRDSVESGTCTATKISKNFIITAAHCFHGKEVKELGFSSVSKNDTMDFSPLEFERIFMHPDFEKLTVAEAEEMHSSFITPDIAIVKIKPNSHFDQLKVIGLSYETVATGSKVEIWGYGCQATIHNVENYVPERKIGTSYTLGKDELKQGHNLMSEYYSYYADSIFKFNISTAGKKKDPLASSICFGDSGGPLLLNDKLVGINSNYTFNDMDPNDENGYGEGISYINLHARISNVAKWIQATLKL